MAINPITGTDHDGLCEGCNGDLTEENLTEGILGFYCSEECCEEAEAEADSYTSPREDFHSDG